MQDEEADKTLNAVKTIHEMVTAAFQVVSAQPALLPLYKQMIESVVVTLPNTRQFTAAIDETFARIEAELSQPSEPEPNPDMIRAQADMARAQADQIKNANEFAVKQEANAIKQEEVELKKQIEDNKVMMTKYEADLQYDLKKSGNEDANITTGYVKAF
jgi:hypothetical protein